MQKSLRAFQRDVVDQQELYKFKDADKNKNLLKMFERVVSISQDSAEETASIERLRRKITHDIEHQIGDVLKLREHIASKISTNVAEIEQPALETLHL